MKVSLSPVCNPYTKNKGVKTNKSLNEKANCSFGFDLQAALNVSTRSASQIANDLYSKYNINYSGYNINSYWGESDFFANCIAQTVNLFDELFGKEFLPSKINFVNFNEDEDYYEVKDSGGCFDYEKKEVAFNTDMKYYYLWPKEKKIVAFFEKYLLNNVSTSHYLQPFVHEFAHCAHYKNVQKNHNFYSNIHFMQEECFPLMNSAVINKFALGKYAFEDKKLYELIAETLTRQILKYPETLDKNNIECTIFRFKDIKDTSCRNLLNAVWEGDGSEIYKYKCETEEAASKFIERQCKEKGNTFRTFPQHFIC